MRQTFCGTYEYMAPEIIDNVGYDKKVDIWSLGILLYELLHGHSPFRGDTPSIVFKNIKAGAVKFGSEVSSEAKDLITGILKKDPKQRLSIEQILNHPLFKKYEPAVQPLAITKTTSASNAAAPLTSDRNRSIQTNNYMTGDKSEKNSLSHQSSQMQSGNAQANSYQSQQNFNAKTSDSSEDRSSPTNSVPKDPSINLPKGQSKIYSLIQKKCQNNVVASKSPCRKGDDSVDKTATQFDSFLNLQKKEILGTNNPLKNYLSGNYNPNSSTHQNGRDDIQQGGVLSTSGFNSVNNNHREQAPIASKISNPHSVHGHHYSSSVAASTSQTSQPQNMMQGHSIFNNPLTSHGSIKPSQEQPNNSQNKSNLHQRTASYTITTRVANPNTSQNYSRSNVNVSYQRSLSSRSIFDQEDTPAIRDTNLDKPRMVGIAIDRGVKNKFEEIVKNQYPVPKSPAPPVGSYRGRDDSRDNLHADATVYKPLLCKRYGNTSRDESVGRQGELSQSRIGNERLDTSNAHRQKEDSVERSHYSSNTPMMNNQNMVIHKPYSPAPPLREENSNSNLHRLRRPGLDQAPLSTHNRYHSTSSVINKENSRYYSNLDNSGYAANNGSFAEHNGGAGHYTKPSFSPYLGQIFGQKPPSGRHVDTSAAQYSSTNINRQKSYQLLQH